ncbi:MAG: transcriptional repressor [Bacteroidetes bacterium]|nr:transcriptional repressor [Bacteroidota bacterium]
MAFMKEYVDILRQHGIQPTPQRLAIAAAVLHSAEHPTADDVYEEAREYSTVLSRATVYNTLNLFVEKGLLRMQILKEGTAVFDPNIERHHHFIDDDDGTIIDIPWGWLSVRGRERLAEFDIREMQVVVRGRRKK